MRNRLWRSAALTIVFALSLGAWACRPYVTHPNHRAPIIQSVIVFPTLLGTNDSTMITIVAADPDGDSLYYGWDSSNGLVFEDGRSGDVYYRRSPSMVFYWAPGWTFPSDTAYVRWTARDGRGGSTMRRVRILHADGNAAALAQASAGPRRAYPDRGGAAAGTSPAEVRP